MTRFRGWLWMARHFGVGRTARYWFYGRRQGWAETPEEIALWDNVLLDNLDDDEADRVRKALEEQREKQ